MIEIHSTKKLMAKLPVDAQGFLSRSEPEHSEFMQQREQQVLSPLSGWHANLLTIQRRNCVLLVHNATRFPLFLPSLKKADFAQLDYLFDDALMNTLMKCAATEDQMQRAWGAIQRLHIDTHCDRSVQGTLNRMGQDLEHILMYDGIDVAEITGYRLAAKLADGPCTVKGRKEIVWPIRAFLSLVDSLPLPKSPQASSSVLASDEVSSGNVISLAGFRQKRDKGDRG